jgi:ribosome-associated protein
MNNSPSEPGRPVVIAHMPIELCQFLKFAALSASGGEAKLAVAEGLVQVNGSVESRKRRKLVLGDRITFAGQTIVVAG